MTTPASINALITAGLITPEQFADARDKQAGAKRPLMDLLVEMGFVKEEDMLKVLARAFAVPLFDPAEARDAAVLKLIPSDMAKRYGVFPLRREGDDLVLARTDPADIMETDDICAITGLSVKSVLATKSQIDKLITEGYELDDDIYDLLKNSAAKTQIELVKEEGVKLRTLDIEADDEGSSPIINLLALILGDAVKMRATDIHIEPREDGVSIRYRIDGYLKNVLKLASNILPRLSSRIKILAELDIAETRKTQDGRVKIRINGRTMDLRLAVVPTFYGEKIAIRLLDQEQASTGLDKLGLEGRELQDLHEVLQKPQGMVLVTGPTGSGKTSTLYAALNYIRNETKQIITIEDPIEYLIDGINQIQLNTAKDVTFATSLRSILRQDPNVIFVGEIRDRETADIAFRASQTGHLVLSSLHTNNAVATVSRLFDIGLEPYLVASSLVMVIAQRLVRLICPQCREEYVPDEIERGKISPFLRGIKEIKFCRGKGCAYCNFSGFYGRAAVFEIIKINGAVRELIARQASEKDIYDEARRNGLKTLAESAAEKVAEGLTTIGEIERVIDISRTDMTAEKEPEPAPQPAAVSQGAAAKVLIVDDEINYLIILEPRLRAAGYQVIKAQNGLEAVEKASRENPDLIIMDVMMPRLDGLGATRALRANLQTAQIPIILLTALKEKESELSGFDAGADDYMTKPYDKDKLLARVRMLLARSRRVQG